MSKLWLTYAWKDNEDQDVDHVIAELREAGLEVSFDRAELLAGQRLWQQIDAAINDKSVAAWAMFVSESSLASEPCQEEIAYALDRALRSGRTGFPIIGIFPRPIDRSLIPSAIATRLYVNLTAPDWQQQVYDGVMQAKSAADATPPLPFNVQVTQLPSGGLSVEIWPRSGRWYPFLAALPLSEGEKLGLIMPSPRGITPQGGMVQTSGWLENEQIRYMVIHHAIDCNNTAHVSLTSRPNSHLVVGQPPDQLYTIDFTDYRAGAKNPLRAAPGHF